MDYVKYVAKAIAAAVTAFSGAYATAALSGGVSQDEWVSIVATTVVATGVVFQVGNTTRNSEEVIPTYGNGGE